MLVVNGSDISGSLGTWAVDETEIRCDTVRGYAEYTVNLPAADVYHLTVEGTHVMQSSECSPIVPVGSSAIILYSDGTSIGRQTLTAPGGIYGTVKTYLPYLPAGPHTFRVYWDNAHEHVSLQIKKLTFTSYGGTDANTNGTKDWLESSLANTCTLSSFSPSALHPSPSTSYLSPVCLEGAASDANRMAIVANGVTNTVNHGVAGRWYANVDLAQAGSTAVAVSFNDGALVRQTNITWTALNVLESGNLTIRKDDSLMLTAYPSGATNGTVTIAIEGSTTCETTVDQPVVHQFTDAGEYTVTGTYAGTQYRSIVVTVIGASFPASPPAAELGVKRTWICPDMPADAVLESDSTVDLQRLSTGVKITMHNVSADHYMVARLPDNADGTPGVICDSAKLGGFWVHDGADSRTFIVEQHATYDVWETVLVMKNLPSDVTIEIQVFIAGVSFVEGGSYRAITSANFNSLGEYRFRLIHPHSVSAATCHTIKMYQGGTYLGQAYYGSYLPAEE